MKIKSFILMFCLLSSMQLFAQTGHKLLRKGDKKYLQQDYATAEENYRKSLEEESTEKGKYNLGNTLYQQDRYEEALLQYESVAQSEADDATRSKAYHNLGNAQFLKQDYEKSIDAYKNALRLQPKDVDTKKNLSMALRQMKMQQQQQQQQQQQSDDQEKEENEDEQKQEQQQEQQDQEDQQESEDQQQEGDEESEQEPSDDMEEKDLSKEEARRLLEIMEDEERKVQEKMRKAASKKSKSPKDW